VPQLAIDQTGGMTHRVTEEWMGEPVETLEDLLRPELRVVCVGINPSCVSVEAGHYYQGRLGKLFYRRLERAGVLPAGSGWEDDRAFDAGIGFTDIVKRPTTRAAELRAAEYEHGKRALQSKLEACRPGLIVFTFKKTATVLLGHLGSHGLTDHRLAGAATFVMPGPYALADVVDAALPKLRAAAERGRG
jgi:TDG/mug DNA glycosylase family protein